MHVRKLIGVLLCAAAMTGVTSYASQSIVWGSEPGLCTLDRDDSENQLAAAACDDDMSGDVMECVFDHVARPDCGDENR